MGPILVSSEVKHHIYLYLDSEQTPHDVICLTKRDKNLL